MPANVSWGSDTAGLNSLLPQLLRLVVRALPACAFVARYILCTYTNKGALSRRLGLILLLCLSVVQGTFASLLDIHPMIAAELGIDALLSSCHAINLLTLVEVDASDLQREVLRRPHSTSLERICGGLSMLCNYRGVRTKWQVKNTPPFPPSFDGAKSLSHGDFCARQITIGLWEINTVWLVVLSFQRTMQPDTPCGRILPGFRDWGLWHTTWPLLWILPFRLGIDGLYRLASAASVAVGLTEPLDWPPAFSSAREAWTLRRFWGVYWHQWLRWPFSAISTTIAENGFGMTKAHLVGRYMHVLFVFTLSGVLHLISDVLSGVPWRKSGSLLFFCSFTLAFMIEDGVQELWRRITEKQGKEQAVQSNEKCGRMSAVEVVTSTPVWKKVVGFAWVGAWLSVSSPVYLQPFFEGLCRQGSTPDYLHMAQRLDPMVLCGGMAAMTLLVWHRFGIDL
ncbi:LOW QUALITY PROTEIN: hypothetical protein IFM46972_01521 [Aspergillus udagawae]|uniref:Wax synthase domain-containing protein n=1 Tax=Aspergillus udagawae TaxID=91492 RepID=A0A8H3N6C5_9EURO|nr:LOW QUALITY PROTEIN: hypothetical protein IFM46972_01521 [Aspergillus udagawae]